MTVVLLEGKIAPVVVRVTGLSSFGISKGGIFQGRLPFFIPATAKRQLLLCLFPLSHDGNVVF